MTIADKYRQRGSLRRGGAALIAAAVLLLGTPAPSDARERTLGTQVPSDALSFPQGGVLFGDPGTPSETPNYVADAVLLAEFKVRGGAVKFIDEGGNLATMITGPKETFDYVADAATVGELFSLVAPRGMAAASEIAVAADQPVSTFVGTAGTSEIPTFDQQWGKEDDNWADGCQQENLEPWRNSFDAWVHQALPPLGAPSFSSTNHWDFGIDPPEANGYFGGTDDVWFGACLVEGLVSSVAMERWDSQICLANCGQPDSAEWGAWSKMLHTEEILSPGERYFYQSHGHYSPWLRSSVISFGGASPYAYFISGAGFDNYDADDTYQSRN